MAVFQSNNQSKSSPLRIAIPKGMLYLDSINLLANAGLDITELVDPGRQLVFSTLDTEIYILRPSDVPVFVAHGGVDCAICGKDSLLEADLDVVELADLKFGPCRFIVAERAGTHEQVEQRYQRSGVLKVASKYPRIATEYYNKMGVQVEIIKMRGNIELAPLVGMADRVVDITATGTTLRENNLVIVDEVLASTARFIANPASVRVDPRVRRLADEFIQIVGKE
ncbi:MAG: ATP phosphoribosyltransferase [Coriobacteriales bacterium]|nr:ATP phosphoribosyltransferase [Coriobacteriales bacterium]